MADLAPVFSLNELGRLPRAHNHGWSHVHVLGPAGAVAKAGPKRCRTPGDPTDGGRTAFLSAKPAASRTRFAIVVDMEQWTRAAASLMAYLAVGQTAYSRK